MSSVHAVRLVADSNPFHDVRPWTRPAPPPASAAGSSASKVAPTANSIKGQATLLTDAEATSPTKVSSSRSRKLYGGSRCCWSSPMKGSVQPLPSHAYASQSFSQ
ncbi:hypothetical protein AMTR_s00011p00201340 [Amborella trichopoda]|uniref:Uncharacterized protein n=1 Tax=Amborella trichopoda TaxID=13333 RepID=W1NHH5_AMBTC|nr:hypothetical protein AMTR_s00011p00201340 [Amborella trichopoda]